MTIVGLSLAFIVTVVFLFALRPVAEAVGLMDLPGGRKRHGAPVPVIGGIAMAIGLGFGSTLIEHPDFWTPTMLGVYLLVAVGLIDDRFDLPANVRLIAQTCASLVVVFAANIVVTDLGAPFFFDLPLGLFAAPFTVLFILTVINAFNVIDGIDGLAGGLAFLALAVLAVIAADTSLYAVAMLLLTVVGAFLLFNLPIRFNRPVRTFMGDAGSTFLGLGVACVGIGLCQGEARMSPVVGLWLIAVPVFDLFSAIVRRLVEGKSPFTPDHEHLHHVLIEHGLTHRATLVVMLSLAALFAGVGVVGNAVSAPDGVMMLAWFAAFAAYYQLMRQPRLVVEPLRSFAMALGRLGVASPQGRTD